MKVLFVVAFLVACTNASTISDIGQKLLPNFATGYIMNGADAEPHSAPYIVSLSKIYTDLKHSCGGTIIHKEWILTAAHCISGPAMMGATAGLQQRSNLNERTQVRQIDYVMLHESYMKSEKHHDIALLHVSEPFEFNEWVQPAALPAHEEIHTGEIHLYGWGLTTSFLGAPAETLQTVETEIMDWDTCKNVLPEDAPLYESNICSDTLQKKVAACNADSGGPLVVEHEYAQSELIGIVSWGYVPCGTGNYPSVYTRVSAYIDWIATMQSKYYSLN